MVSTFEKRGFEDDSVQVRCTECGELTWNTYTKLCNKCFKRIKKTYEK